MNIALRRTAGVVGSGLLALGMAAPQAHAQDAAAHCWVDVETGDGGCFNTLEQVIEDISGGGQRVVLLGDEVVSAGSAGSQTSEVVVAPAATVILGRTWDNQGYGGASYTYTASADCDTNADVDYQWAVMPTGWNDRISSFESFGQCATKIWENGSFQGATYGFVVNSSYVGSTMNDKASSVQFN